MAWGEVKVADQKKKFIESYKSNIHSITHLCKCFNISRPTAYKWIDRFYQEGEKGLKDLSRAPHHHPNKTDENLEHKIMEVRALYPDWGARKILGYLKRNMPDKLWPSDTTIHNILERNGFIVPRKVRRKVPHQINPLTTCEQCNQVWCVDFKGWFLTGDGMQCAPLTLTDHFSRYLLKCVLLPRNTTQYVWEHFSKAFKEHGLPNYVRSDNGAPFGSTGVGRLCKLAIKLIKAGVIPEWIEPGKPQQNGRHERMHRTLKKEAATPPSETYKIQKERLFEFQDYYNYTRPHESLGQQPPGTIYQNSKRIWNGVLKLPEYDSEFEVRKVRSCGTISWHKNSIYIGRVLETEPVGIKEMEAGHEIYYGPILLGFINRKGEFESPKRLSRKRRNQ